MKRKKILSWALSAVVAVTMCFGTTGTVFAGTGEIQSVPGPVNKVQSSAEVELPVDDMMIQSSKKGATVYSGATVAAQNFNTTASPTYYDTPNASGYKTYTYNVKMPKAGTIIIGYVASYLNVRNATFGANDKLSSGVQVKYYHVNAGGTYQLEISGEGAMRFGVMYAAAESVYVPYNKVYYHGANATNVSQFKVSVPSTGYLTVTLADGSNNNYSLQAKTKGYSNYVTYSTYNRNVRQIGVKKGVYTFTVKSYAPVYAVKVKFTKVKESKYGKKKSKAKKIKRKKLQKGLMITGAQKTHWYKFKNTKKKKVKLIITSKLTSTGTSSGGIKVTCYKGKKKFIGTPTITEYNNGETKQYELSNTLGGKLAKGTYYVKVQCYQKGTGYYTLKWK